MISKYLIYVDKGKRLILVGVIYCKNFLANFFL